MTRILAAVLCAVMLVLTLASCGKSGAVMTYTADGEDYTLTEAEYDFLMKYRKYMYCYSVSSFLYSYDIPAFWSQTYEDGATVDETLTAAVRATAETMVIEKYLMDKFGITLADKDVKEQEDMVKSTVKNFGGEGVFKKYWGYNSSDYLAYQLAVLRSTAVFNYLYDDENGAEKLTDAQLEEYYNENYKQYQFIVINTKQKIATDEDGKKLYKVTDGSGNTVYVSDISEEYLTENKYTLAYDYKYTTLTDEEKTTKASLADELIAQLKSGADFKELAVANSDNFYSEYFPNGMIISGDLIDDATVMEKINALEVGAYTEALSIESGDYIYIVKRVELKEKAYEDAYEGAEDTEYAELFESYKDTVKSVKYDEYLKELAKNVVSDESILSEYTMANTFLSEAIKDRG